MSTLDVVILAAGKGTRMKSDVPKVLHKLGGRALLERVVDTATGLEPRSVSVVYGHGGEEIRAALSELSVTWTAQREQLGTGHALQQAISGIAEDGTILVLYGDVPLITHETLREVVSEVGDGCPALITVEVENPSGYGRMLRDARNRIIGIIEERDADESQRAIREINTGILAARTKDFRRWIPLLANDNAKREYYLTDIIELAVAEGGTISDVRPRSVEEVLGVNDRVQLARLERHCQSRLAEDLMRQGVTLYDPSRLDIRGNIVTEGDVTIDVNVILEGTIHIGRNVSIGPNSWIRDCTIGEETEVLANCVIEETNIGARCRIGPYSRIRPQTHLSDGVHIGNFVEVKKSEIGSRSKANHLSYVGDSTVGRDVNIGAGTITCNYDGANKHRTVIEDGVFIGSGTELVAPVTVATGGTVGAGSTITHDTPPEALTVARSRQTTFKGWKRPRKEQ